MWRELSPLMGEGGILYLITQGSSQNAIWTTFHLSVNAFAEEAAQSFAFPPRFWTGQNPSALTFWLDSETLRRPTWKSFRRGNDAGQQGHQRVFQKPPQGPHAPLGGDKLDLRSGGSPGRYDR